MAGGADTASSLEGRTPARWITALALLVACVRLNALGRWSLWIDEVYTLADSLHGDSFRNPLGYWLYRWFLDPASGVPDEWTLRLPPALLGILSVPLCAWALAPLVGRLPAAASALLLALSSWHVFWSQTADFYTLAMCLSLAGTGLAVRSYWNGRLLFLLPGLGLSTAAVLAHPSAIFVPPALVIGPLLLRPFGLRFPGLQGRLNAWLLGFALLGAIGGGGWMLGVWQQWLETLKTASPAHFVLTTGFYLTPLLGAGAAVGAWRALRTRDAGALLALAVVMLGLAGALLASLVARVSAQYIFCLLPWVAALAALPLQQRTMGSDAETRSEGIDAPAAWRRWAWLALLALPLAADLTLYFSTRHGERARWKEAYRYVWNERRPEDQVFGMAAPVGEYYLGGHTDLRRIQRSVSYLDTFRAELPSAWARYDRGAWFVVNREELEDWSRREDRDAFEYLLANGCSHVAAFPVRMEARDINVDVYYRPRR